MNGARIITALYIMMISSLAVSEGNTDRVHGSMIQDNERAMQEYAIANGQNPPEVVHYRYGMKLDIAKVVHMTSTDGSCKVMPAQMAYEDSNGNLNILEYRAAGTGCFNQN
jgi:hypothetical protein